MVLKCHHNLVASFMALESGGPNLQNAGKVGETKQKAMPGSYVVPLFLKNQIYIFFWDTFQGKLHLGLLVTWSFACKRFEN